ncbi:MAG: beta-ketoacyl-ACP synthase II [Thermodesulfobacteriota bacterium]|nr:beta-ketoacyl-ACP synthase II [Thermodesulfobacteriota bacterium]
MKRRVVITGLGVISPLGVGLKKNWNRLLNGESGIKRISRFDPSPYPCQIAGEVDEFDPLNFINPKFAKRMDTFIQYAVATAKMAIEDAGLKLREKRSDRVGVYIGTTWGGIPAYERALKTLQKKGHSKVSAFLIPSAIPNLASSQVAIHIGATGPNSCSADACAAGTISIGGSFRMIQRGDTDIMIAGGAESVTTQLILSALCNIHALSIRNDEPEKASRPFDRDRDGFILSEGSGLLVLEELDHAIRRGARIYAEVIGFGMTSDAYHIVSPHPEGLETARCMQIAIDDAKARPEDVDLINAHGTSTQYNDKSETLAIKKVFKNHAYNLSITANKSMIGHLMGAAGGIEAIFTALSIYDGIIPPTINYENADPECDLSYTPNVAQNRKVRLALSNSFGFGGVNGSLLFREFK